MSGSETKSTKRKPSDAELMSGDRGLMAKATADDTVTPTLAQRAQGELERRRRVQAMLPGDFTRPATDAEREELQRQLPTEAEFREALADGARHVDAFVHGPPPPGHVVRAAMDARRVSRANEVLTDADRLRVSALAADLGLRGVSRALGISRETLARLLAGLPIRYGSQLAISIALARIDAEAETEREERLKGSR